MPPESPGKVLHASITNLNFTFQSTQNAHIAYRFSKNFLWDYPGPLYWEMNTSLDPTHHVAMRLDLGAMRLRSKPSVSRSSITNNTEKVGEKSGISFGLGSGHHVFINIFNLLKLIFFYLHNSAGAVQVEVNLLEQLSNHLHFIKLKCF